MSANEIFREANHLSLPVPADTPAGVAVRIGVLNGFTETPEGAGVGNIDGYASINLEGAFRVDVDGALTKGAPVYIVEADGSLTSTDNAGANPLFGASLSEKAAGIAPAVVKVLN